MPLWLIGMMGSGKSTLGRELARRLGKEFIDLDEVVESIAGATVEEIFSSEGEAGFRRRETEALVSVKGQDAVVATGGGAVTTPANVETMQMSGTVVWLQASVHTLLKRLHDKSDRPLLDGVERRVALEQLSRDREPIYTRVADFTIDTERLLPADIVRLLEALWIG